MNATPGFINDPAAMLIIVTSVLCAIILLTLWKKYNHASLLYAHLFFTLNPIFFLAIKVNCSTGFVQGLLSFCTLMIAKFLLYLVPPLLTLTFIAGYAAIPQWYRRNARPHHAAWFKKICARVSIPAELFLIDKAQPTAFTLGKNVFVSVGMFELLSKKELEAVVLHELAHVKARASWNKFSAQVTQLFSPVAWFSSCQRVDVEEQHADDFAVNIQGTDIFLRAAQQKVTAFR